MAGKGVERVGRNALVIAVAGLGVRALGLVREIALAYFFGAGMARDCLAVALRVPSVLRGLFAEGAMAAAFVPAFTEYKERRGTEEAHLLANVMLAFLMLVLGLVVASFVFAGKYWVLLFAGGFVDRPEALALATRLTALAGPFILLVSLATVLAGMLNVSGRFFLPALAPAVLNVAAIAGCVLGQPMEGWLGVDAVVAVAASYTVGGVAQFVVLYPATRRLGFRLRPRLRLRHPGLVRIILLMLPGLLGLMAIQLTNIIDMQVASRYAPGVVSYVEYSFRLVLFPISMVGMALATATLAKVSLDVAARDQEALRTTVSRSVSMLFLVATPIAGLLFALAEPVTQALFVGGEFTFDDAHETAVLLQLYALGVAGFCYPRVAIPIFFALGDSLRPMLVALLTIGLKLALVVVLLGLTDLEIRGLVVATSVAVSAEAFVIWWLLRRRIGRMVPGTTAGLAKIALATLLSAGATAGALALLPDSWDRPGKLLQLAKLIGGAGLGWGVYLAVCTALGVDELRELLAKVRSKLRPPGPPPGRGPAGGPPGPIDRPRPRG